MKNKVFNNFLLQFNKVICLIERKKQIQWKTKLKESLVDMKKKSARKGQSKKLICKENFDCFFVLKEVLKSKKS